MASRSLTNPSARVAAERGHDWTRVRRPNGCGSHSRVRVERATARQEAPTGDQRQTVGESFLTNVPANRNARLLGRGMDRACVRQDTARRTIRVRQRTTCLAPADLAYQGDASPAVGADGSAGCPTWGWDGP